MFSETVHRLSQSPYHLSPMPDATVSGNEGIAGEGPYMVVHLKVAGDVIEKAGFETYSCPVAIACGSWVAHWVEGRSLGDASKLGAEDLTIVLGGLPLGKEHCAMMATGALHDALKRWEARLSERRYKSRIS
jgi:nitrogen fixation NifU-like protein